MFGLIIKKQFIECLQQNKLINKPKMCDDNGVKNLENLKTDIY